MRQLPWIILGGPDVIQRVLIKVKQKDQSQEGKCKQRWPLEVGKMKKIDSVLEPEQMNGTEEHFCVRVKVSTLSSLMS